METNRSIYMVIKEISMADNLEMLKQIKEKEIERNTNLLLNNGTTYNDVTLALDFESSTYYYMLLQQATGFPAELFPIDIIGVDGVITLTDTNDAQALQTALIMFVFQIKSQGALYKKAIREAESSAGVYAVIDERFD